MAELRADLPEVGRVLPVARLFYPSRADVLRRLGYSAEVTDAATDLLRSGRLKESTSRTAPSFILYRKRKQAWVLDVEFHEDHIRLHVYDSAPATLRPDIEADVTSWRAEGHLTKDDVQYVRDHLRWVSLPVAGPSTHMTVTTLRRVQTSMAADVGAST